MEIKDLKDPVWECQENEKPKQYKPFLKILKYGKVDLKRLHEEESEEYNEALQKYEEDYQEYEKALKKYNKKGHSRTSKDKKSSKKDKPKKPKKPQKPYAPKTLRNLSSENKWDYRLKQHQTQDHEELLLDLYLDLKKDLKDIYNKQVELYKEASNKLFNDLINGEISWSQFNYGVQGLKALHELLLQQQEKPTSYEKKDVNGNVNVNSTDENYLFVDELSDYNVHDKLKEVVKNVDS